MIRNAKSYRQVIDAIQTFIVSGLLSIVVDVATIVVLGSGLYLWIARGRSVRRRDRYDPALVPAE